MACASRRRRLGAAIAIGLVLLGSSVACTEPTPPVPTPRTPQAAPTVTAPLGVSVTVVLPPRSVLADEHLTALRSELETVRTLSRPEVRELRDIAPDDPTFTRDVVDMFAARSSEVICVLGSGSDDAVQPFVTLHPTTRFCAVPAQSRTSAGDDSVARLDLRAEELGYLLGAAAVATVGSSGTVGVRLGGAELPADRLLAGVRAAAEDLQLLQVPPNSEMAVDPDAEVDALVEAGASLLILDGSFGASEAVARAATSGVDMILPASLADGAADDLVVATWEVGWAALLVDFLAEVLLVDGERPAAALQVSVGVAEDAFSVSVGGAAPGSLTATWTAVLEALADGRISLEPA